MATEKYYAALEVVRLGRDNVPEDLYNLAVQTLKDYLLWK